MAKRLREYVKYTTKELDKYTEIEGCCVRKVNTNLHLSMGPFCLTDFKRALMDHIVRTKVGFYDVHLNAIVLDVKQIKVLGTLGGIRADDANIHVDINADVYIFKPEEGAELTGLVKHIGQHQVGVILYRVFNANLKVAHKVEKSEVDMDQEVKFRIRKYNLQNRYPYIEGELLTSTSELKLAKEKKTVSNLEDNVDSGIEERDGGQELDELLSIIKTEPSSDFGEAAEESKKKKSTKDFPADDSLNLANKKSSRKRKISSTNMENAELSLIDSFENIKRDVSLNDDNLPSTSKKLKKVKKDKLETHDKKRKRKSSTPGLDVQVKEEIEDDDFLISS